MEITGFRAHMSPDDLCTGKSPVVTSFWTDSSSMAARELFDSSYCLLVRIGTMSTRNVTQFSRSSVRYHPEVNHTGVNTEIVISLPLNGSKDLERQWQRILLITSDVQFYCRPEHRLIVGTTGCAVH